MFRVLLFLLSPFDESEQDEDRYEELKGNEEGGIEKPSKKETFSSSSSSSKKIV
nr:9495_t:CDS:2 [Entrophospora candida]